MINENININIEGVYNPWNPEHIIDITNYIRKIILKNKLLFYHKV